MATGGTPELTVEIAPGTYDWEARGRTVRLSHFAKVSARYRTLRELDFEAVRIVSDVVARAVDPGRPVRLVDVATGSGRYLDAVNRELDFEAVRIVSDVVARAVKARDRRSSPVLGRARPTRMWPHEHGEKHVLQTTREKADADLRVRIEDILAEFPSYGYRRITHELRRRGQLVNHKRVSRVMRTPSRPAAYAHGSPRRTASTSSPSIRT